MGIQHLLLLLIYLDPLNVLCAATANKKKNAPKRNQKMKEVNGTEAPTAVPRRNTQVQAPSIATHDTCLGYYDVSGAYDKVFECNNTEHRYCCGSCFLRYCCAEKGKRIEQKTCTNYNTPDWIKTQPPSPAPTGDTYDPDLDQTNTTVYITCGVIAFIILIGVSAKVAYDKATKPPQEMNVHRALADILRQQGLNKENENIAALEGSPKDMDTPLRTSKNHYTPVHTMLANHGGCLDTLISSCILLIFNVLDLSSPLVSLIIVRGLDTLIYSDPYKFRCLDTLISSGCMDTLFLLLSFMSGVGTLSSPWCLDTLISSLYPSHSGCLDTLISSGVWTLSSPLVSGHSHLLLCLDTLISSCV
nr:protein shisa-6-like [Oncorhynchus nerka]